MLGSIKDFAQQLAQGWRELSVRAFKALTRFTPAEPRREASRWGLLAGEVADEGQAIVVRLEVPGVERKDLTVEVRERMLVVTGERRVEHEHLGRWYHVQERAYGRFERRIALPGNADSSVARATLRNGVLTVTLKKLAYGSPKALTIS